MNSVVDRRTARPTVSGARTRRPVDSRRKPRCPTRPGVKVDRTVGPAELGRCTTRGLRGECRRRPRFTVFSIPKFFLSISSPLVPRHFCPVSHTPVSRLCRGLFIFFFLPSIPTQAHASPVPEHRRVRRSRTGSELKKKFFSQTDTHVEPQYRGGPHGGIPGDPISADVRIEFFHVGVQQSKTRYPLGLRLRTREVITSGSPESIRHRYR